MFSVWFYTVLHFKRWFNVWTYGVKSHSAAYTLYVWTMMPKGISPYVQMLTYTNWFKYLSINYLVNRQMCKERGCKIRPRFNVKWETKSLYCSAHKTEGMVYVKNKRNVNDKGAPVIKIIHNKIEYEIQNYLDCISYTY